MKKFYLLLTSILFIILLPILTFAQDIDESTATFFDDNQITIYEPSTIIITGEVENEITVNTDTITTCSFPFKDVRRTGDKKRFLGSYYITGVSLYDILKNVKLQKVNEKEFRPLVDLYIIVENYSGDKTVFSWGEIFYSKDNYKSIITKSIVPINPSKGKMKWEVPDSPRLICANDLTNERFINNPSRITVKTYPGNYSKERLENIYSPSITIEKGSKKYFIENIPEEFLPMEYENIGYGHGRGFKGIDDISGYRLDNILRGIIPFDENDIKNTIVIFSAKDGYRVAFSLSEIINRNDLDNLLITNRGESECNGKFTTFNPADFFVDRNVRSVEKIELIRIDNKELFFE